MGQSLAFILAPIYLMIGLSILLYAKAWRNLIDKYQKDHLQLFPLMFFYAFFGMIFIMLYNVWTWDIWLIVTLTGWAMLVKSVLYFLLPGSILKPVMGLGKNLVLIYIGGVIATVIGAVLGYYTYFA